MLHISVNERDTEPTVIKKANQFTIFKFGDIQPLDIKNVPGGSTNLGSFLKAYKTSERKTFFPYNSFGHPDKTHNTELPLYGAFYSKLESCNPLEAENTDFVMLLESELTTKKAVIELKFSKPSSTGIGNCHYLQQSCKQEQMSTITAFFPWQSNMDVVSTLKAMQKRLLLTTTKILLC